MAVGCLDCGNIGVDFPPPLSPGCLKLIFLHPLLETAGDGQCLSAMCALMNTQFKKQICRCFNITDVLIDGNLLFGSQQLCGVIVVVTASTNVLTKAVLHRYRCGATNPKVFVALCDVIAIPR